MKTDFIVNDSLEVSRSHKIPEVHPILGVVIGTSMADLVPIVHARLKNLGNVVPWRSVVIDSIPYEDLVTRIVQNGFSDKQVRTAIPRSHYLHLKNPFTDNFDFDAPLNKKWENTIFDPVLRQQAKKPDAPGCGGLPALGKARVEYNRYEIETFFENHIRELTQIKTKTLSLLHGICVFIFTTKRGGTGVSSCDPIGAIIKSVEPDAKIHLCAMMPDIYGGDHRSMANAYASIVETQQFHSFNSGVPLMNEILPAPFETVRLIFSTNGRQALRPRDVLMHEATVFLAYCRPETQSSINTRIVDLTDVAPYDYSDKPMHCRQEIAISIRPIQPGAQKYLALVLLARGIAYTQRYLNEWYSKKTLSPADSEQVKYLVDQTKKDLNIDVYALLRRIDPSQAGNNKIRSYFERIGSTLGNMQASAIKQSFPQVPQTVRNMFPKLEGGWEENMRSFARTFSREIIEYIAGRTLYAPHIALAALDKIIDEIIQLSEHFRNEAESAGKKRDAAGAAIPRLINEVQESGGILWFKRDEVARDAANKASDNMRAAALYRIEQQHNEYIYQALAVGLSSANVNIPSVLAALKERLHNNTAAARKMIKEDLEKVKKLRDHIGQILEMRSPVFQRSLYLDDLTSDKAEEIVDQILKNTDMMPPVKDYIARAINVDTAIDRIIPYLPTYSECDRSLEEMINNDSHKKEVVVKLLRSQKPFTPIEREVESQQELRNRRDNMTILEIPKGKDGSLADLFIEEGIVANRNLIINSGNDEIRMYYLRDGLPYSALRSLKRYHDTYTRYMDNANAISPHTVRNAYLYTGIEPAKINLTYHTKMIMYVSEAIFPNRIFIKPSGEIVFKYNKDAGKEFKTSAIETFQDYKQAISWLARRPFSRKDLELEIKTNLDNNPEEHKIALINAWKNATGEKQEYLQEALYRIRVDPLKEAS